MSAADHSQTHSITRQGIGVSSGVAIGPVFLLSSEDERVIERAIGEDELEKEIERFNTALSATRAQLIEVQKKVRDAVGEESARIFDAHILVLDDKVVMDEVTRGIRTEKRNAETILTLVTEQYAEKFAQFEDDYLRERVVDLRDVTRRVIHNLVGHGQLSIDDIREPCILVANDLAPSDAATLDRNKVLGLAVDLGSPTSHTAIMARALEIPAIVGLHDISVRVTPGNTVLIDGDKGTLIIDPSEEQRAHYDKLAEERNHIRSELEVLKEEPAETLDGYRISLSANIELASDVDAVLHHGAFGVGLFRTEFLYLSNKDLPSEDEQAAVYTEAARRLEPNPLIIRTLDLGGDKFVSHIKMPQEVNPFMGWRAIRFCLAQPALFRTQLRAVLRASVHENIKLMYPMISNVEEVLRANTILEECKRMLRREEVPFNEKLEVGVMIEVPSAALTVDLIAPYVSFFSLGTNDLSQYTLAVDRVNERIAYLYEPTHPAIIKLIKNTIDVGHDHGIWTGVCGEMAANPLLVPLLVGLGVDEISVSPNMTPLVKDVIRSLRFTQAEELAKMALKSTSGDEVLERCRALIRKAAPEILELVG